MFTFNVIRGVNYDFHLAVSHMQETTLFLFFCFFYELLKYEGMSKSISIVDFEQ